MCDPINYYDPSGYFPITTFIIGAIIESIVGFSISGAEQAWETSTSLGITGWERFGYTISGIFVGNYLVAKNNWDSIKETINMDGKYNFKFQDNPYYNFWTASLFAKFLKNEYYDNVESRTASGLYLELQFHYLLYLFGNNHGTNGAYMGPTSSDSNV